MSFTSGLHGPRVLLTMAKTFDDLVVISVISFAQDNLESSFTPRYARLSNGCPNREYWCELGLVLFVIGRCTHFDILNCIFICLTISRVDEVCLKNLMINV